MSRRAALQEMKDGTRTIKTYWLEAKPPSYHEDGVFKLYVDGHRRATCSWRTQDCVIHSKLGTPTETFSVFQGDDFFGAVERKLGIGRAEVWARDGENLGWLREEKERSAYLYTRGAPHGRWGEVALSSTIRCLDEHLQRFPLFSGPARTARAHAISGLEVLNTGVAERLPEALDHVRNARDELVRGRFSLRDNARAHCEAALGDLEYHTKQWAAGAQLLADFEKAGRANQQEIETPSAEDCLTRTVHNGGAAAAPEAPADALVADDSDRLFQPSRASRVGERERDDARGNDAEDTGREM